MCALPKDARVGSHDGRATDLGRRKIAYRHRPRPAQNGGRGRPPSRVLVDFL